MTKARIRALLRLLDRDTDDAVDAVFALLDDTLGSWFAHAPAVLRFADGATTAHIGCHVGILQRGRSNKLDREGRDYWIKPLRELGAIEPVTFRRATGNFVAGHPIPKSPHSAYRLTASFVELLRLPAEQLDDYVRKWIGEDVARRRLEVQAQAAAAARDGVDTKHLDLIKAARFVYAPKFLPRFELLYVDESDGERVPPDARNRLAQAGLELRAEDPFPDVLLWRPGTHEFWVIEAVTSDGEVDPHKVRQIESFIRRGMPDAKIGYTTAYPTWKDAARRQSANQNLAPGSYVWIMEDASKVYHVESF